jgi:ATP-dependent DNA ligase
MITCKEIVKRDSAGKLRTWSYEVDGKNYRTIAGIKGGNLVTSAWTACVGKQKRTDEQQAHAEAESERSKKLDREYRETEAELDEVPPSPMLAKKYEDERDRVTQVFKNGGVVYSQPKLDGIRAFVSRHGAFSREYQRHLNVDHILAALAHVFVKYPDLILDGELYNHDLKEDFNKIASVVRKQKPNNTQRAEALELIQYHIYDVASSKDNFAARAVMLGTLASGIANPVIQFVPTSVAGTQAELDALNGAAIAMGYEGQMVRINAPYEVDKRSKYLLKRKEFDTAEFPLLRIEEGKGNWAGAAKTIVVKLPEPTADGSDECGSGMRGSKDFAIDMLKKGPAKINSKSAVTVRYFGYTPDKSLRFPVVIDWHFDGRAD